MSLNSPFFSILLPLSLQSISYDHVELNFFLNGKSLDCPVHSIRGSVYPTFYGELAGPLFNSTLEGGPYLTLHYKGGLYLTPFYGKALM